MTSKVKQVLLVLLVSVLAVSCDGIFGSDAVQVPVQLSAESTSSGDSTEIEANVEEGEVVVRGEITLNACNRLTGSASRPESGNTITLVIHVRPGDSDCAGIWGTVLYEARLLRLEAGEYELRVKHDRSPDQPKDLVFLTLVTVPQ